MGGLFLVGQAGAAVEQSRRHKHAADRAADLTHPRHAAAEAGGDAPGGIRIQLCQIGKGQQNGLRTVAAVQKILCRTFGITHCAASFGRGILLNFSI